MADGTLLDAILRANEARSRGDGSARADLPPGAFPFVITCMDPRLVGSLVPAMGLERDPPPQAKFAGAVIRPGDVSGVRSVLAAAIFNTATEVFLVGHTDCRMGKTSAGDIRSGLSRLGVRPDAFEGQDAATWLGAFTSEGQAVRASVEALRFDSRMPPGIPVHGLLFNLESRRLEVVVRGYDAAGAAGARAMSSAATGGAYVPGPANLSAPPQPVFGAPGFAPSMAPRASGPSTFGAAPPLAPGPVSFGGSGPVSGGPSTFGPPPPPLSSTTPLPAPAAPSPHPMPSHVPTSPSLNPADSFPAPRPMDEPLPPPVPTAPVAETPRLEPGRSKKKKPRGSSPFDRAHEVLDRMRRDRDPL